MKIKRTVTLTKASRLYGHLRHKLPNREPGDYRVTLEIDADKLAAELAAQAFGNAGGKVTAAKGLIRAEIQPARKPKKLNPGP
jgi:hypothetical protein